MIFLGRILNILESVDPDKSSWTANTSADIATNALLTC